MTGLELGFGWEQWTTATHLQRALERRVAVTTAGAGHQRPALPDPSPPSPEAAEQAFLWVESGVPWLPTVDRLRRSVSAAWLIDTHRGIGWRRRLAGAFDLVFVAQADAVPRLRSSGIHARWLPLAAPADLCTPGAPLADRPYDVAFVGQAPRGSLRAAMLDALEGVCRVAPRHGYVAPPEMMGLYASARIVVNLPLANDLNMRVFEAAGARSLLLTGPATGLGDVLPEGSCTVVHGRTVQAWVAAVEAALADATAQSRADAAHRHVLDNHTYDHRAATVLDQLGVCPRRGLDDRTRAAALGSGFARWGLPRQAGR